MKQAYLKGYYGYKNFGDELLFFGVIDWIFSHYPKIQELVVEVGNKTWMEYRVQKNYHTYLSEMYYQKISFVEIKQHRWRRITHILNFLGYGKYRSYFRFFGGGEVLSDAINFTHDGRNIPLLFSSTIRKKNFILLGGIGTPKKRRTTFLYNLILPRAKAIITRDPISYTTALKRNKSTLLYQDFSQHSIQNTLCKNRKEGNNYVLINGNLKSRTPKTKDAIITFCQTYAQYKKIFFPCDMNDDTYCVYDLQQDIPDLEMYDWTKYDIQNTLCLFSDTKAAIGARLHFLFPLKLYQKKYSIIADAEKIFKMIKRKE